MKNTRNHHWIGQGVVCNQEIPVYMANHKEQYGADSIRVLEGLEAVRTRPGMYIGSVSTRGLNHLI